MATIVSLAGGQPSKSRRKVVERVSCPIEGVYTIGLCVPRISSKKIYSSGSWKNWDMAPRENSGKTGSIRKESCKSAHFKSAIRVLRNLRKEHETKP